MADFIEKGDRFVIESTVEDGEGSDEAGRSEHYSTTHVSPIFYLTSVSLLAFIF